MLVIKFTVLLLVFNLEQVTSFWFTDTSLFEPPSIQISSPQIIKTESQKAVSPPFEINDISLKNEPWIRVEPKQQLQQELQLQQQQECQCNVDWLQNQTSSWLNKWLASANVASQMRLLMSNSTGATSNIDRRDAKQHHDHSSSNNNNNNSNHWTAWIRAKGNNGSAASISSANSNGNRARLRNKLHGQQQQTQLKQAQAERGPQGPKGEIGARGDKGERGETGKSGLISVKDRDSLFDLGQIGGAASMEPTKLTTTNKQTSVEQRLVFIEAEQMLVVGTDSGWRPVHLLPPLRDFRTAIAKFSLSSPEQRRRLLLMGSNESMDNSIKPLMRHGDAIFSQQNRRVAIGSKTNQEEGPNKDNGDENDEGESDDDGEDEDEDDDEDDQEDGDENGDELSDDNIDEVDNSVKNILDKKQAANRVSVSGRSAAALVSIDDSIMDSPSVKLQVKQVADTSPISGSRHFYQDGDSRMKLRVAALNEPFSGNIHGIRGADFECKRNAARANVKGSFRAFLASGFQNLNEVVRHNVFKYPIVNLRGEILANSWHDLFKQPARIANPLSKIYSFDGRHVATDSNWPNKLVWHGATNKAGYRDSVYNCDGWHSDSLSKFGYATPLHSPRGNGGIKKREQKRYLGDLKPAINLNLTQFDNLEHGVVLEVIEKYPCRMPLILLCIETIGQQSNLKKTTSSYENNNDI